MTSDEETLDNYTSPDTQPPIDRSYPDAEQPSLRELEVLQLYACGIPRVLIEKYLKIGKHTVNSHRKNAFAKIGVKNVTHAVAVAIRKGWIE
ncbi:MAG TPA: helix-turn-helix transcriptional regulator [Candidatus Babeliales bacterium]|nr:helix-turn-helix transcriptional regulator [Candidatus Babeliales bacterium]